jgi:hypothetical protein
MSRSKSLVKAQNKYSKNNIKQIKFDLIKNNDIEMEIISRFENTLQTKKGLFIKIYQAFKKLDMEK